VHGGAEEAHLSKMVGAGRFCQLGGAFFVSWAGRVLSVGRVAVYSPRGPADERCASACAFHHSAGQHSGLRCSACSQSSTADSHARLACKSQRCQKGVGCGGAACMGRDLCARVCFWEAGSAQYCSEDHRVT
jgi:hypothetical protein